MRRVTLPSCYLKIINLLGGIVPLTINLERIGILPITTLLDLNQQLTELNDLLENLEGVEIPADLAGEVESLLNQQEKTQQAYLEKIDRYLGLIQSLKYWVQVRKSERDRINKIIARDERTIQFLQTKLKTHLESQGVEKLRTNRFNLSVCRNGGKTPIGLAVRSPEELPEKFQRVRVEADMTAIREALEAGEDLSEIAHWKQKSSHLLIK